MVKKCIVEYDELNKPIAIIELKEFNDVKSFKDFEEICKKNREDFDKRIAEKEAEFKKQRAKAVAEMEYLKKGVIAAMKGISYILGYEDYSLEEIVAVFKELLPEGEKDNEERND